MTCKVYVLRMLVIGVVVSVGMLQAVSTEAAEIRRILILHSYHQGFAWTDNITTGIRSVLDHSGLNLELYIEHMDVKRYRADEAFPYLEQLYRYRYQHLTFDVILLSDDFALNFVLQRRDQLFPGVPIVFCGINNFTPVRIAGHQAITGVVEDLDMLKTIELAIALHPGTSHVAVINDGTPPARGNHDLLQQVAPKLSPQIKIIELFDLSASALQDALRQLPAQTVILHCHYYNDKETGRALTVKESFDLVRRHTNLPIYTLWDFQIGYGATGGIVTNGTAQGKIAAEMAVRILHGEPASTIPVLMHSPNTPMFDYPYLTKFGLTPDSLPMGSIVLHRPISFYSQHRTLIWLISGFMLLLMGMNIALMINMIRRKRAENALRESEARYRNIFTNNHAIMLLIDPETAEIVGANPAACTFYGYNCDNLTRKKITAINTLSQEEVFQEMQRAKTEQRNYFLFRHCLANGEIRDVEVYSGPILMQGRTLLYSIVHDVTERRRIEEALQRREQEYKTLVEHTPDVIARFDRQYRHIYVNPAVEREFGSTPESLLGKTHRELGQAPVMADWSESIIQKIFDSGQELIFELTMPSPEGNTYYLSRGVPEFDEHGSVVSALFIHRNITERKQAEEAIQQLNAELEARVQQRTAELEFANRDLQNFIQLSAHDLKTPLRGISQLAYWLAEDFPACFDADGQQKIDLLIKRVKRLDNLLNGMVEYSQIGRLERRAEPIDLNTLLRDVLAAITPPEHIQVTVDPDLPTITGEYHYVRHLFYQLLRNAVTFMDKPEGAITIRYCDDGEFWRFSVTDNGPGIESRYYEKIFQIFQTLEPKDVRENTGIGLAVVKKIVELYGGAIWVESLVGQGSTFLFTLPKRYETAVPRTSLSGGKTR